MKQQKAKRLRGLQTSEEKAKILRDALEKKAEKEGVSNDWFRSHVIVDVASDFTFDDDEE